MTNSKGLLLGLTRTGLLPVIVVLLLGNECCPVLGKGLFQSVQSHQAGSELAPPSSEIPAGGSTTNFQCKDGDGNSMKWFIAYKLAKLGHADDENVRRGLGFVLLHPNVREWAVGRSSVNSSESPPGRTLRSLFQPGGETFLSVAYNDQPPDKPAVDTNGHTKGVILADENGGIWLQHSVPHFPKFTSEYSYPETGIHNGQILFCMTLTQDQLNNAVAGVLQVTKPHFYNVTLPKTLAKVYPNLYKIVGKKVTRKSLRLKKKMKKPRDDSAVFPMDVASDVQLTMFAKSPAFHQDVYSDWIAPTLKSGLKVQTWLNGPNPLPSNCTLGSQAVKNILNKEIYGFNFSTHSDHSKWAVGDVGNWMCISDLNRMRHQFMRGGATLCFKNPTVWTNFQEGIKDVQPCG